MASFSIPLTGLQADSQALATISNNLANMNTTAFKDQTTSFSSLFYQQIGSAGSGDPLTQGLGVQVDTTATNFTTGSISQTPGVTSNMALNGNGFFVAQDPLTGAKYLTQAGNFTVNSNGNLVTSNGLEVLGYPAVNGTINSSAAAVPIVIPENSTQSPTATTAVSINANLTSTAPVGTIVNAPVTMYDSLGGTQNATVTFTANGGGSWNYAVTVPGAVGNAASTGTLQFNSLGQLVSPSTNISGIGFTGLGTASAFATPGLATGTAALGATQTLAFNPGYGISGSLDLSVVNSTLLANPTPTAASAGVASTVTFSVGAAGDTLSGPFSFQSAGSGATVAGTFAPGTTIAQAVTQLNAAFAGNGMTATANGNSLVVTGPAGTGNTISLGAAGATAITETPLPTSVTTNFAAGTNVADAVDQLNSQASFKAAGLTASAGAGGQLIITGPAGAMNTISLAGSALSQAAPGTILSDGASALNFALNLYGATGASGITQTAAASTTSGVTANGNASGTFASFSVAADGTISATYSNGLTSPLAQVAIASVTNLQGLTPVGSNDYVTNAASGQASLGIAGTGGRGTIQGSALEASNVDISTEFANLIVAQNAFAANSKSVTTFNTVDQDILAMMR